MGWKFFLSFSLIQLTKKAITPQFRNFLRTQNTQLERLFGVLSELSANLPVFIWTSFVFFYVFIHLLSTGHCPLLCLFFVLHGKGSEKSSDLWSWDEFRYANPFSLLKNCFRLVSELLKQDSQRAKQQEDYTKHIDLVITVNNNHFYLILLLTTDLDGFEGMAQEQWTRCFQDHSVWRYPGQPQRFLFGPRVTCFHGHQRAQPILQIQFAEFWLSDQCDCQA